MGLRFRKRLKILPGVFLNIGKGSASVSVGVPGASVTRGIVGSDKTTQSVGLVGTGLSYTEQSSSSAPKGGGNKTFLGVVWWLATRFLLGCLALVVIFALIR
jgi:Protein of unknown function (DUF4236)